MIVAEGMTKQFDQFTAVDGIDLNVPAGEVLVLLGPNGAGKTTTVRMLTALLTPTRGRASIAGHDVVKEAGRVRSLVGVLTEHHSLYARMRAEEYLEFYGQLYQMDPRRCRARIDELLATFDLETARKKKLGEYSKGMRQKLALARAMLHEPPVLLLDEPTSAMDPESARMVRDSIRSLRSADRTVVLCTHNLLEAEELADQVSIIRSGKIILSGSLETLKRELLGPVEYEARFSCPVPESLPELPDGVRSSGRGPDWARFQVEDPERANPWLLQALLENGWPVVTFEVVSRSLEQVYLDSMQKARQ